MTGLQHWSMREKLEAYPIVEFFAFTHLPEHLQAVSEPFCKLALVMAEAPPAGEISGAALGGLDALSLSMSENLPKGPETLACLVKLTDARSCFKTSARLRFLLEGKDCAVRAELGRKT